MIKIKENSGQAAAELILIFGGIIVIVMIGLIFYKKYVNELSKDIKNNEVSKFNEELKKLGENFK